MDKRLKGQEKVLELFNEPPTIQVSGEHLYVKGRIGEFEVWLTYTRPRGPIDVEITKGRIYAEIGVRRKNAHRIIPLLVAILGMVTN